MRKPLTRTYVTKDGQLRVYHYDRVKGMPLADYKRVCDQKLRAAKRAERGAAPPPKRAKAKAQEPPRKVPSKRRPRKAAEKERRPLVAERLSKKDADLIRHYYSVGVSQTRLAERFGTTRYVIKQLLGQDA